MDALQSDHVHRPVEPAVAAAVEPVVLPFDGAGAGEGGKRGFSVEARIDATSWSCSCGMGLRAPDLQSGVRRGLGLRIIDEVADAA